MKVLISGAGIAGLALAYELSRNGHDVTVVEKWPSLRDTGYLVVFFGAGYEVAREMGLLADLRRICHPISRIAFVDETGAVRSSAAFRTVFGDRHLVLMRGDLARVLYGRVADRVRLRFGTTVEAFRQAGTRVSVALSDATSGEFDLLVGADGVHSQVRRLAFGEEGQFARPLGYRASAFVSSRSLREPIAGQAVSTLHTPGREIAVWSIRDNRVAAYFVYKARSPGDDLAATSPAQELDEVYGDLGWVVPELLEVRDRSEPYFGEVSQIELPQWSVGRVVLIGDAAHCVSLVAAQGASVAMLGAYVLAQELERPRGDLSVALRRYEARVRPHVERKQWIGRQLGSLLVPKNRARQKTIYLLARVIEWPFLLPATRRLLASRSILQS